MVPQDVNIDINHNSQSRHKNWRCKLGNLSKQVDSIYHAHFLFNRKYGIDEVVLSYHRGFPRSCNSRSEKLK